MSILGAWTAILCCIILCYFYAIPTCHILLYCIVLSLCHSYIVYGQRAPRESEQNVQTLKPQLEPTYISSEQSSPLFCGPVRSTITLRVSLMDHCPGKSHGQLNRSSSKKKSATNKQACKHTNICAHTYIHHCVHACMHAYIHIHACIHKYLRSYIRTYVPTYRYIYIYIHIHTYIQTDRQTDKHSYHLPTNMRTYVTYIFAYKTVVCNTCPQSNTIAVVDYSKQVIVC